MAKVLLVTVGGSPQPIITSVNKLQPDRVIFFCSTGKQGTESQVLGGGFPCEIRRQGKVVEQLPNLPTHLNLGDRFQAERDVVRISDPDHASECYRLASETIRTLLQSYSKQDILVDYTGGTKTMSLSLGMAGIDYDVTVFVTTGPRTNRISIERGEIPARVLSSSILVERQLEQLLPEFLNRYDYPAALSQLENLLRSGVPQEFQRQVRDYLSCCQALDAWDRFDHHEALYLLEPFMRIPEIKPILDFLKRVMHSRAEIDPDFKLECFKKFCYHGYEIVEDLLLNAERRAKQERYDDAVGRLYRALELLMQIHLKRAHGMTTVGVEPERLAEKLPDALQERYAPLFAAGSPRKFGVTRGYELLRDFTDDPLGQLYKQHEAPLTGVLKIRNMSLFAHGFEPITADAYRKFYAIVIAFIDTAINRLGPADMPSTRQQFPTSFTLNS